MFIFVRKLKRKFEKNRRKFTYQIICMLSCIILATSLISSVAKADTANKSQKLSYLRYNDGSAFEIYWKHFDDGNEAFCLVHNKLAPTGNTYTRSGEARSEVKNIIEHSSVNDDPALNFYIKQLAVHYCYGELSLDSVTSDTQWIADAVLKLYNDSKNVFRNESQKGISLGSYNANLTLNGDYYESSDIVVKRNCDSCIISSNAPEGTVISVDGGDNTPINGAAIKGGTFKVKVPASSVSNVTNINITLNGSYVKKVAYEYEPDSQDVQRLAKLVDVSIPVNPIAFDLNIQPYGKLTINKIDKDTNQRLAGAEFQIINKNTNDVIQTLTTNENGTATTNDLLLGEYLIKETKAPEKYALKSEPFPVTLSTQNQEITIDNNMIVGSVEVSKADKDTKKALSGAVFEIINKETGNVVETLTTNAEGKVNSSNLKYGEYTIHEIAAPEGYNNDSEDKDISISTDGQKEEVIMLDSAITNKVKIKKVSDSDKPIKGVVFEITNEKGQVVDTLTTDGEGNAESSDLAYGKYTLKEVSTAEGYILNDTQYPFEVVNNDDNLMFNIVNDQIKGKIAINKIDEETKQKLAGATFELKDEQGNIVETLITDEDGYAESQYHPYGKYYLVETQAPKGYLLNSQVVGNGVEEESENKMIVESADTYEVSIEEDEKLYTVSIENKIIKGKIGVDKVDRETSKPMANVEFEVYDKDNNLVAKLVTDEDGHAETDMLNYGKYTVKETKTNEGYILSTDVYEINLEENNKIYLMRVQNTLMTGTLNFTKTDFATSDVIPGAMIEIKGISDTNKDILIQFISESEGNVIEQLPYGKYEFREINAPDGYILTDETGEFEIKENGEIVKATLCNKKKEAVGSVEEYRPTPVEEKEVEKVKLKTGDGIVKTIFQVGIGIIALGSLFMATRKKVD